jgi:vacuolar-type H+-ATPase subunit H
VGKAGGLIISHEVTRLYLGRDSRSALFDGVIKALPPEARPTKTTFNTGALEVAGETVDYRYLPAAHTNGDLFIHFKKRNVIAAGGPVSAVRWPVMDYLNGAFMHGFVRSYDILAEVVKPDTIIIPAEGPTLTGADILKQRDMYWALFKTMFANFNKGFGPQDVIAAFREVANAGQDAESSVNEANTYSNRVVNEAKGDAARITQAAQAYREQVVREAQGEADRFAAIDEEYKHAPAVTRQRLYTETMERILHNANKVVVDVPKGGTAPIVLPPGLFNNRTNSVSVTAPPPSSSQGSGQTQVTSGGQTTSQDSSR